MASSRPKRGTAKRGHTTLGQAGTHHFVTPSQRAISDGGDTAHPGDARWGHPTGPSFAHLFVHLFCNQLEQLGMGAVGDTLNQQLGTQQISWAVWGPSCCRIGRGHTTIGRRQMGPSSGATLCSLVCSLNLQDGVSRGGDTSLGLHAGIMSCGNRGHAGTGDTPLLVHTPPGPVWGRLRGQAGTHHY